LVALSNLAGNLAVFPYIASGHAFIESYDLGRNPVHHIGFNVAGIDSFGDGLCFVCCHQDYNCYRKHLNLFTHTS